MTTPPRLDGATGHRWQPRADGRWVCLWIARRDIVQDGYRPKTQRIWPPTATPDAVFDDAAKRYIEGECQRLQDDMISWSRGSKEKRVITNPITIDDLIAAYKSDPDSDYQALRFKSKESYDKHLKGVSVTVGARAIAATKGRDFKRWFQNWSGDGAHIPRAHARITMVRLIISFGVSILEDKECQRLAGILAEMKFQQGGSRDEVLTSEHVVGIRGAARAGGAPSMALAEAFKMDLIVRRKDVIGEWIPQSYPGLSAITDNGDKWIVGIDFSEIDENLILRHRVSKSIRGKQAIVDRQHGKVKEFNLRLYPMAMEELAMMAGVSPAMLTRDMLPASGPLVRNERTGLPYRESTYRQMWRGFATAAGVPKSIQSRDSRAGGITDAIAATGGDVNAARQAAGHSQMSTTMRYAREEDRVTAQVAQFRSAKRPVNSGDK